MGRISEFLTKDHRECDVNMAKAEEAASKKDWESAATHFAKFRKDVESHFVMEEEVFFPAFEERTGNNMGPTAVMRHEHIQIRDLMGQLNTAAEAQDKNAFLNASETMHYLLQQHNAKEEQILYAMADRVLGDIEDDILSQMKEKV